MEGLRMISLENELRETIKVWPTVSKVIFTIHDDISYKKAQKLLDTLIDSVCEKEDLVKDSLIETLGTLIKEYEDKHISEPAEDPIGNIRYLMQEHGLKQSDLKELGSQGIVSEILNGKRKLNIRQIKKLSKRFNVSPSVFIGKE